MSTVGFDLDMTLVDTRPGIARALRAFAEESGRPIDAEAIVADLGPPVAVALSPWFEPAELPAAVDRFRWHVADVGVFGVEPLPGAAAAIDAVRATGHEVIVITAKIEPLARATLANAGLEVDDVFGNVWAEGKTEPLRMRRAVCYVGDHSADMVAAAAAGVPGFGVTSGATTREELLAAGAKHVAASLEDFPSWLASI